MALTVALASLTASAQTVAPSTDAGAPQAPDAAPPEPPAVEPPAPDLASQLAAADAGPAPQPQAPPPYWYPPPMYAPYPPEEPPEPKKRWYGWQTLIVDGVSVGLLALGAESETDEATAVGAIGYFFGPPIVHFFHGNAGRGFGSMGIRVAPIVLLLLWASQCDPFGYDEDGSSDGCVAFAIASLLGFPAAIAVDTAVLAFDTPKIDTKRRSVSRRRPLELRMSPIVDPRRGQLGLGLRAEF